MSLDGRLAAKGAGVAGVLADFHLFHLFAQGGAVYSVDLLSSYRPVKAMERLNEGVREVEDKEEKRE